MKLICVVMAVVELLGPGQRRASRMQLSDRADGSGQFVEVALMPGVSGFSRVQLWTSQRVNGGYTRRQLQERELPLASPVGVARELAAFGQSEGRVAVLTGGTENTVRMLSVGGLSVSRPVVVPGQARLIATRPGSGEVWVGHGGAVSQLTVVDPGLERVAGTVALRLNAQAVLVGLNFAPNGRTAYVVVRNEDGAAERGVVMVVDAVTRVVRSTIGLGSTRPLSAAMSADGSLLFVGGTTLNDLNTVSPSLSYVDTLTGTVAVAAIGLAYAPEALVAHPNGRRLYWPAGPVFGLEEFDVQGRRVVRRMSLPRLIVPQSFDVTAGGEMMVMRDGQGQSAVHLDLETGQVLDVQAIPAGISVVVGRP
ncbi:MAG: YncE family protein [Acidobacteriota bacterium]